MNKKQKAELELLIPSRYQAALDFQKPYFTNFNEYYRMYRSVREENKQNYKGRANLFVPAIYSTIETIMPRMVGAKPKLEAAPMEPNDIANASAVSKLLDYQWDKMGMKIKVKDWVKQCLIYGVGVMKLTWSFRGYGDDVVENEPESEVVDLFDFFMDPNASCVYDAEYVIHRTYRHLEELKKNENYKVPKGLETEVMQDEYKLQRDAVIGVSRQEKKDSKKVEVFEYWGKYDINGDGIDEECLIVMANRKYVLRAEENPYAHKKKPFIVVHDTKIPHEFWSVGEVEPLQSLQYELNDIRNQRMDNVTLILNRMWKVAKGADVDEEDLISQAGQIIHAGDIKGVEPLDTPDVTSSAYNEETIVKSDIQQASGVTDYTKGQGGSEVRGQGGLGNETATGIMLLQEAGNARFRYKLDNLEDALKEFGKQLIALDQQYLDQAIVIRIVGVGGNEWKTLSPEQIRGSYDIVVEAGSTQPMNKSVRRAEARELLATVAPFAQFGINLTYFIKYLLQTYDLTDINEAFGGAMGQIPGAAQAFGGQEGAALGGDVGNRPNNELQRMATPEPTPGQENILSQSTAG